MKFEKYLAESNISIFYGTYNDYLFYVFLVIRVYFLIKYSICFFYKDQVKLRRILNMYGIVNIKFLNIARNLYKWHDVSFSFILLILSLAFLVIQIIEFEMKNENIQSIPEAIYFLIVTMTTVGYGEFSPLGKKGQLTIVSAISLGVIFEGMFLIAWQRYMSMDSN